MLATKVINWRATDGSVVSGLRAYFFEVGTETQKDVYSDRTGATELSQPVMFDSNGEIEVASFGTAKVRIETSTGSTVKTYDEFTFTPDVPVWSTALAATGGFANQPFAESNNDVQLLTGTNAAINPSLAGQSQWQNLEELEPTFPTWSLALAQAGRFSSARPFAVGSDGALYFLRGTSTTNPVGNPADWVPLVQHLAVIDGLISGNAVTPVVPSPGVPGTTRSLTIANQQNVNLYNAIGGLSTAVLINVTLTGTAYSTNALLAAFDTGGLAAGSIVNLTLGSAAKILGAGGAGGTERYSSPDGGDALRIRTGITFNVATASGNNIAAADFKGGGGGGAALWGEDVEEEEGENQHFPYESARAVGGAGQGATNVGAEGSAGTANSAIVNGTTYNSGAGGLFGARGGRADYISDDDNTPNTSPQPGAAGHAVRLDTGAIYNDNTDTNKLNYTGSAP